MPLPLVGALLLASGCAHTLSPAATPEASIPLDVGAPPAPGEGRLIVDVVDGPTRVDRVYMAAQETVGEDGSRTWTYSEAPEPLCDPSPCVLDMPPGNVLLGFPIRDSSATELELVNVGEGTSVYRRSLSQYQAGGVAYGLAGIFPFVVGILLTIPGIVITPIGAADDNDQLLTDGIVFLSVGGGLTILGAVVMALTAPQRQPGSAIHFPVQ